MPHGCRDLGDDDKIGNSFCRENRSNISQLGDTQRSIVAISGVARFLLTIARLRRSVPILNVPSGISDLVSAIRAGGVTIETTNHAKPDVIACRTLLQLDGDMMVYGDKTISSSSPEWIEHVREIDARVAAMSDAFSQFTDMAHYVVTSFFSVVAIAVGCSSSLWTGNWWSLGVSFLLIPCFHFLMGRFLPQSFSWASQHLMRFVVRRVKVLSGLEPRENYRKRARTFFEHAENADS